MTTHDPAAAERWRVRVLPDRDPVNPRQDADHLGVMVCWHRRASLGDRRPTPEEHRAIERGFARKARRLRGTLQTRIEAGEVLDDVLFRYCRRVYGATVLIPLGLYEHGGRHIYLGGGSYRYDPQGWDSGTVGWVMDTTESRKRLGVEPGTTLVPAHRVGLRGDDPVEVDRIRQALVDEVETYDQFLRGDLWGFVLERFDGEEWQREVEGWGFYGLGFDNGMADYLDEEHHPLLERALDDPDFSGA